MISHKHKTIFVHIPKTAGQSIEETILSDLNLEWSNNINFLLQNKPHPKFPFGHHSQLSHLTILDYLDLNFIDEITFDKYFKFSFVRNPYFRTLSLYKHLNYSSSFKRFVGQILSKRIWEREFGFVRPQFDFVANEHGEICVDFIGKFEDLENDFNYVQKKINICNDLTFRNKSKKHSFIKDVQFFIGRIRRLHLYESFFTFGSFEEKKNILDYFDSETKEMIQEIYCKDFANLGYSKKI